MLFCNWWEAKGKPAKQPGIEIQLGHPASPAYGISLKRLKQHEKEFLRQFLRGEVRESQEAVMNAAAIQSKEHWDPYGRAVRDYQ